MSSFGVTHLFRIPSNSGLSSGLLRQHMASYTQEEGKMC